MGSLHLSLRSLILVPAVAVAAPLLVDAVRRWASIPLVVFEIGLGILLGPSVAGWIDEGEFIGALAQFGLAMLFFLAGKEIDFARIRGRPLRRSALGWLISLGIGIGLGALIAPTLAAGVLVGICLTTTSLGTILPVLRDAGQLATPFGESVMAIGAVGEFGPLIAVTLFLSGRSPGRAGVVLAVFALLIAIGLVLAIAVEHRWINRLSEATLHTSGQFAVRLVILLLACLVGLATVFGLDILLGAFAAGVLVSLLLSGTKPPTAQAIDAKLDALGFGFLVPIFFVNTGVAFDLRALTDEPSTLLLVPAFAALLLLTRGIPATLAAPAGATRKDKVAAALFGATGLPLIVAVTAIGVDHGELKSGTAAALIAAGMVTVLIYPLVGLHWHRSAVGAPAAPGEPPVLPKHRTPARPLEPRPAGRNAHVASSDTGRGE